MNSQYISENRLVSILCVVFAVWLGIVLYFKFKLLYHGLATDDLFNYLNALHNTNFWDKWLFTARYERIYGQASLLFSHWQPTLLILFPIIKLGGAESLLVVQAVAPLWAAIFLLKIAEHIGLRPFDRLFVIVVCLFHPNLMAAVMDSLYGFHGTSLLLYFGGPLAWAAITRRWRLALALLLLHLNVRESGSFYVFGAAFGFLLFGNAIFDNWRRMIVAVAISATVFVIATVVVPKIFDVPHIHTDQAMKALLSPDAMMRAITKMDSDWHNLFLWIWPALLSPGTLMAMMPESFILIVVGKKASHWYGMTLVFAGSIALAYGLLRVRAFAEGRGKSHILTGVLILHMIAISIGGPKEIRGQSEKLITRIGIVIPNESKRAARAAINDQCRTTVEFQAMYGFGDLPYLQYPRQANISKYLVTIPTMPSGLTTWVKRNESKLKILYKDQYLAVFENPALPCR